tara:strand:+ start:5321 stop:7726 length:2406 start_codon:yes stop_codon:yes gene_type:complete
MGQINVKGLGVVDIAGDAPTKAESEKIKEKLNTLNTEIVGNTVGDIQAEEYANGPNFGRIATEVAGSIAGSIAAGGFTLPGLARVVGMRSLPFLKALAKASAGSAAGGAGGAIVAETFDPSENVVKEVARAAGEGALGEAVGAPLAIKAAPIIQKILGAKPKIYAETIKGADVAEETLKNKSYEILYGKEAAETLSKLDPKQQLEALKGMVPDDKAINDYIKRNKNLDKQDFANLKRDAIEAQKGLTPAFKTNNQFINISETILSKSILGGGQFADRYRALKNIGDAVAYDYVQDLTQGSLARNKAEVGNLFLNMFNNADRLFKEASDSMYQKVDNLLGADKIKPTLSIVDKVVGKNSLRETVDIIQKNISEGLGGGRQNPVKSYIDDLASDLNKIEKAENLVSYRQLSAIRSDLAAGKNILKVQGAGGDKLKELTTVIKKMDDMLSPENLLKSGLDPNVAKALEDAKIFYEQGMDVFQRGTTVAILAKAANATSDLGTIFKNITTGEKINLLGRVLNDIEKLPELTKNTAFREAIGNSITRKEADSLKDSLRGYYLQNMLSESVEAQEQFGTYYNVNKFRQKLNKNQETLKLLFPDAKDIKKIEDLQTTLGFAQGKISDISGIPGGVLIQLKQAGAAGQLLQFGGGLLSPANVAAGGTLVAAGVIPALGVVIAPKYVGKAMLDPKFQKLAFEAAVDPIIKKENTPRKMQSVYNQMLGRLVTLGIIPKSEADDYKSVVESQIRETEQRLTSQAVPLPSVEPSNFPVIETGAGVTEAPNTQLASALNLFNKGGIVSAKKVNT